MAQIDSVSFYLYRTDSFPTYSVTVNVRTASTYTTNPGAGAVLGSKSIAFDSIPTSAGWVTWTFDTPISITSTGFYAIQILMATGGSDHAFYGHLFFHNASDWSDASGGVPYDGKERFWYHTSVWNQANNSYAYRVSCTDADGNLAETPTSAFNGIALGCSGSTTYGWGLRTYIVPDTGLGKATNPTPADGATDVSLNTNTLSWTAGTGATGYKVYLSWWGSVSTLTTTGTSITLSDWVPLYADRFSWDETYTWRVDSTNDGGEEVIGDEWSFTTRAFDPPVTSWVKLPGMTLGPFDGGVEGIDFYYNGVHFMAAVRRGVAASADSIWYEDMGG